MNVSSLQELMGASAGTAQAAKDRSVIGKDDFLTLLIEQLKGQDPLNPQDPAQFTSQLAQFSSLEQLFNLGDELKNLTNVSLSLNNASAANFLSREVTFAGSNIQVGGGAVSKVQYELDAPASSGTLHIYNASGAEVRTVDLGALPQGMGAYQWDGQLDSGETAPDGNYTYRLEAASATGDPLTVQSYWTGRVTGISYGGNGVLLDVGGVQAPLSDVVSIHV